MNRNMTLETYFLFWNITKIFSPFSLKALEYVQKMENFKFLQKFPGQRRGCYQLLARQSSRSILLNERLFLGSFQLVPKNLGKSEIVILLKSDITSWSQIRHVSQCQSVVCYCRLPTKMKTFFDVKFPSFYESLSNLI